MFALFLEFGARTRTQDLWPFLISENRAEISDMNPRRNSSRQPGQPGQPRAHVKRPWAGLFCLLAMLVK